MSCEKYQQLLGASSSSSNKKGKGKSLDETMTEQWVKANTKQCPNCQTVIEKKGGCKKMHCYDCKHIFDWEPK
jgi:ariadne-1